MQLGPILALTAAMLAVVSVPVRAGARHMGAAVPPHMMAVRSGPPTGSGSSQDQDQAQGQAQARDRQAELACYRDALDEMSQAWQGAVQAGHRVSFEQFSSANGGLPDPLHCLEECDDDDGSN